MNNNEQLIKDLNARVTFINGEKQTLTETYNAAIANLDGQLETTNAFLSTLSAETPAAVAAPATNVKKIVAAKPAATTTAKATTAAPATNVRKMTPAAAAPATAAPAETGAAAVSKRPVVVKKFSDAQTLPEKIFFTINKIKQGSNAAILKELANHQTVDKQVEAMVRQATSKAKVDGKLKQVGLDKTAHIYALAD